MKTIILVLLLTISPVVFGCPSGDGATINVTGIVKTETFPGPPNYESIKEGDRPESYWMLILDKPMCFAPDNEFLESEVTLNKLQLLLYMLTGKIELKEGEKYEFIGTTTPAENGHHRTKVMLEVKSFKKL